MKPECVLVGDLHLLYTTCFNSFVSMKILFPNMIKWVGRGGAKLHAELAREIRSAIGGGDGVVTMTVMEKMSLMKSVVYEALRIEPPVPSQYARVKHSFQIESYDAAFQIKEGEIMYDFQPFATKDPKIFDRRRSLFQIDSLEKKGGIVFYLILLCG
ncbi:hypothetical protein ACS0TY_005415 [Phlomoides rotata]